MGWVEYERVCGGAILQQAQLVTQGCTGSAADAPERGDEGGSSVDAALLIDLHQGGQRGHQ